MNDYMFHNRPRGQGYMPLGRCILNIGHYSVAYIVVLISVLIFGIGIVVKSFQNKKLPVVIWCFFKYSKYRIDCLNHA